MISLAVCSDVGSKLQLFAAQGALPQFRTMLLALVFNENRVAFVRFVAIWKVAGEWTFLRHAQMLDHMLFESSGRRELTLAFQEAAIDDAWGVCLVFQHVNLKAPTFDERAA